MNIGLISLGCAKNRVDSEIILYRLKKAGYKLVSQPEKADLIIINTCAFIEDARQESIDEIIKTGLLKSHGRLRHLVVVGCLAQRYGAHLLEEMPELDGVVGISHYDEIEKVVEEIATGKRVVSSDEIDPEALVQGGRVLTTPAGMAYLRISDGCDNRCSYCAIPGIRGALRSHPLPEILTAAEQLVQKKKIRELVVIAQDTAAYGMDLYGVKRLPALLEGLQRIDSLKWIRLMYLHPVHMDDDIIDAIAGCDRVLPYLDIPVQHASDRILRVMNRRHDSQYLRDLLQRLRERVDGLVLRTTVMTGFPGESDDDYRRLYDFVAETAFDWLGAFRYQREEGTAAYRMVDKVPEEISRERLDGLMRLQNRITRQKNIDRIGSRHEVLVSERVSNRLYLGRSYYQAPEVDGITMIRAVRPLAKGEFVRVDLKAVKDYDMIGEITDEHSQ